MQNKARCKKSEGEEHLPTYDLEDYPTY